MLRVTVMRPGTVTLGFGVDAGRALWAVAERVPSCDLSYAGVSRKNEGVSSVSSKPWPGSRSADDAAVRWYR